MDKKEIEARLTDKQIRFCEEYLIDLNGTQAALRAGYSETTARSTASENMTKPDIQDYIAILKEEMCERYHITIDAITQELGALAFSKMSDFVEVSNGTIVIKDFSDLTPAQLKAVVEVKATANGISVKLHSKVSALEMLGRYRGIFKDNMDVTSGGEKVAAIKLGDGTILSVD